MTCSIEQDYFRMWSLRAAQNNGGRLKSTAFLAGVLLLVVLVSLLGQQAGLLIYRARVQRDSVAAIERAGGKVLYAWQLIDVSGPQGFELREPTNGRPGKGWPTWMVNRLGVDYFDNVTRVRLLSMDRQRSSACVPEAMQAIGRLPRLEALTMSISANCETYCTNLRNLTALRRLYLEYDGENSWPCLPYIKRLTGLRSLWISGGASLRDSDLANLDQLLNLEEFVLLEGPRITDDGLRHLRGMRKLRSLSVDGCQITSDGLIYFANMDQLRSLSISGTRVADLQPIAHLRSLTVLNLRDTQISDSDLGRLSTLIQLTDLSLADTRVSDVGMTSISKLTSLESLDLTNTDISDRAMSQIAKLFILKRVRLVGTKVTDSALTTLMGLRGVSLIDVRGTKVTRRGVSEFVAARPEVRVLQH
jgi:hypothetical protein